MKMAKPSIKLHVKPILASVLLTWQNRLSRQQHHVALQLFGFDVCTFVHRIPIADLITSECSGKEPRGRSRWEGARETLVSGRTQAYLNEDFSCNLTCVGAYGLEKPLYYKLYSNVQGQKNIGLMKVH